MERTNNAVIVLLAPVPNASIAGAATAEAQRLAESLPAGVSVRVAHVLDEPYPLGGEWTAAIELHGEVPLLTAALNGLGGRIGDGLDAAHSAVVVGADRVVFDRAVPDGVTPVKMYYALFGYQPFDRQEFSRKWWERHAPLVRKSPYQLTYHQLHADPAATAAATVAAGLGLADVAGVAHEEFPEIGALAAAAVDPELADERDDLALFADRQQSRGMLSSSRLLKPA